MTALGLSLQAQLNRLPEPARLWLARLGWPGLLAAGLSAIALLAILWFVPAQERALELQREQLTAQRQGLKQQQL
ncbi:hypothetical protein, partial [Roseateles sp.]|uniref:hypothetical protein n=1 Tax=Roseateles sp. TaxID=1971397 RepID=UPI00286A9B4D